MAVHVAVGQEADKMKLAVVLHRVGNGILPGLSLEQRAAVHGVLDERGALIEHAAAADRVVTDLAVAHILVRRHADRAAVGLEGRVHSGLLQRVQRGFAGLCDDVALGVFAEPHAVHDDQNHRPLGTAERS